MRLPFVWKARTAFALGLGNVARVAEYRVRLRAGRHPVQRIPDAPPPREPFFRETSSAADAAARRRRTGDLAFGWIARGHDDEVPDWHRNVLTGARAAGVERPWWDIADFDPAVGDVKGIWEASRLDWVMHFAQRAAAGDCAAVRRLNGWLDHWSVHNPPYRGPNWKCGQEASIRVLHLAAGALILAQTRSPAPALVSLLEIHLRRIAPTVRYAIGQDNNHGTSEAAALFVGGSWLALLDRPGGAEWARSGRALLAERVARLVAADGTFSQYSVTYHRLLLDTLSIAEVWRRHLGLPPFSEVVTTRARAATAWLRAMVDATTGDAPNVGANDGADLLPLTDAPYRDFRPSVQLASALFDDRRAYPAGGPWDDHVAWLGQGIPAATAPGPASALFDDGGFAVLRRERAVALLRYPRFRFRPSHADALHLDLLVDGDNVLRDAGSYSYAADMEWQDYFGGARGHNTVQFDDRQQMPRLGRFLWGDWLRTGALRRIETVGDAVQVEASYVDRAGATHRRHAALSDAMLRVTDTVGGFARRAVLRWRLRPGSWRREGHVVTDGTHRLTISSSVDIVRVELVPGWESRLYGRKTELPVLEVEIAAAGQLVTEYAWPP